MRILVFTHYYPPETNAPASRTSEHCRHWAARGYEVTVVTCAPNHPRGRPFAGYTNRWRQTEMIDGVRVVRVWTYLAANRGFARRSLNHLSYLATAVLSLPHLPRADVIVTTSPQFFCGLVGLPARFAKRAPWVLEIRDLWPDSIVAVGAMRESFAIRVLRRLEAFAYRRADRIVAVSGGFVPAIAAHCEPAKIAVVPNGADLCRYDRLDDGSVRSRVGFAGRFIAAYVGTFGMAHGLETIIEAAKLLRGDPRIGFLLVGDGAERERLEARIAAEDLDNIRVVGPLPKEDMPAVWSATDASLVLLRRADVFTTVLPSKMFEAMAMRCPIVLGVEGEARKLLDDAGAGIGIPPQDAAALAAAVTQLAGDPARAARLGDSGRAYVERHHDRRVLADRYLDLLQDVSREWSRPA